MSQKAQFSTKLVNYWNRSGIGRKLSWKLGRNLGGTFGGILDALSFLAVLFDGLPYRPSSEVLLSRNRGR